MRSPLSEAKASLCTADPRGTDPRSHMLEFWGKLRETICCPEDGEQLEFSAAGYSCRACSGLYPVSGRIADLCPRSPQPIPGDTNPQFAQDYSDVFHRPFARSGEALAWGATEVVPARWAQWRERQVRHIQSVLKKQGNETVHTFCDFSAGAGYYTLAYARLFPLVLHCDLSGDSLLYASQKAEKLGIENVLFLRIDYLKPPVGSTGRCNTTWYKSFF
jgi:hypothetical protein